MLKLTSIEKQENSASRTNLPAEKLSNEQIKIG
jgi:hypothetical protein